MKKTIMSFAVLGVLILSGCSGESPSPFPTATIAPTATPEHPLATSADDVLGIWQIADRGHDRHINYIQFNDDGTFQIAQGKFEGLENGPHENGLFGFTQEKGLLTLTSDEESLLCRGKTRNYEVRVLEQGGLTLTLLDNQCGTDPALGGGSIIEPYH